VTLRVTRAKNELFVAYAKSRSTGDLNNFGTLYQNQRSPLVFENEDSLYELDVPHRLLLWGTWTLSKDIQIGPGLECSGFRTLFWMSNIFPWDRATAAAVRTSPLRLRQGRR
jgi:hypothetical protein